MWNEWHLCIFFSTQSFVYNKKSFKSRRDSRYHNLAQTSQLSLTFPETLVILFLNTQCMVTRCSKCVEPGITKPNPDTTPAKVLLSSPKAHLQHQHVRGKFFLSFVCTPEECRSAKQSKLKSNSPPKNRLSPAIAKGQNQITQSTFTVTLANNAKPLSLTTHLRQRSFG